MNSDFKETVLKISSSDDLHQALIDHFTFISTRDDIKNLLKRMFSYAKSSSIDEDGNLKINFVGGGILTCCAPAERIEGSVPASYAALASRHNFLHLELRNDVPIVFTGVNENGSLNELDDAFMELLEDIDGVLVDEENIKCALIDSQNMVAFFMNELNENGEPALYYIDHGGGNPEPVWDGLTFSEAFFIRIAEKLLDKELFPKYVLAANSVQIGTKYYMTNAFEVRTDFDAVDFIPSDISHFTRLKELAILTSGELRELPSEIGMLERLEFLCINSEYLEELPEEIGNLKNLKTLEIFNNKLKSIPAAIGKLKNLEELDINGVFESIPEEIGQLKKLKVLKIESEKLAKIPDTLSELTELKKFWFRFGNFEDIPESIGKLTSIEEFVVVFQEKLKKIPKGIGNLTKLKEIILNGCEDLNFLPDVFDQFPDLENFQADGTGLNNDSFVSICKASGLKTLKLNRTNITIIPPEISNLKELESLNLNSNPITEIAPEISVLSKLTTLRTDSARFRSFPIGLLKLKKLQNLDLLADNCTFEIPSELSQMKVSSLVLGNFTFDTIPDIFFKLTLAYLEVVNCQNLKSLPVSVINTSKSLQKLQIKNCPVFKNIPEDIEKCLALYEVLLMDTAADEKTLKTICTIPGLFHLKLEGHKITAIPEMISSMNIGKVTMEDGVIRLGFDKTEQTLISDLLNIHYEEYQFDEKLRDLSNVVKLKNPSIPLRHHLALMLDAAFYNYSVSFVNKKNDDEFFKRESEKLMNKYLKVAQNLDLPWIIVQGFLVNIINILIMSGELNKKGRMDIVIALITGEITSSDLAYNLACYYSVSGEKTNAFDYIKKALRLGRTKESFMKDTDFQSLWGDPDFKALF